MQRNSARGVRILINGKTTEYMDVQTLLRDFPADNIAKIEVVDGIGFHKIIPFKIDHDVNRYGQGDLLVHVNVWTPKTLNREQKQFFQKMTEDENFIPKPEKSDKSFFEKVKDMFA